MALVGTGGDELVADLEAHVAAGPVEVAAAAQHGEHVEAGLDVELQLGERWTRPPRTRSPTGTRTTTSSESPSAIDRIGWSSSFSSMSHTICWAASPRSSAACDRWSRPAERRGIDAVVAGAQHPELEPVLHLVEAVLEVAHLGGQALVAQHERRVGQADGHLGDVLHLDEHVDGPVEVGQRAVLGRHRGLPVRGRRQLAEARDARRASRAGR